MTVTASTAHAVPALEGAEHVTQAAHRSWVVEVVEDLPEVREWVLDVRTG